MPNTKSAIRKVKKVKKQALLNKFWKRKYKLAVKNMEKILEKKNKKEAISSFPKFQSELMRVAKKGVVNKKSAARKISRISKKIKNITK
ncbi:MAG: 30S ribosomal protein S20 [Candidatus Marinimicrobia bacterium]|nr:30S ribosomal protein S20 [Candidatus Neomarinimicrobiota bacterium]|tara:strand:+ start:5326 stop:5592 length:267 start_codon:yes stop_codon:yes gene_type:complete